ncbi:1-aminocyclopropane-1-carboxylate synthase 3 [Gossypium arboreum]|uniref:1-aminocyclopropane-1-carboxylate synthase 3 n=1 Tax=Gossypium arboreum TaxID=29729 RepID=A0A0B0P2T8_GOSAR|nr:1-aminocyclopropane-1-carboxylate synthase 3 [Gossypium arboreum]
MVEEAVVASTPPQSSVPLKGSQVKPQLVCLYPFTSTSSATQRKIKQRYDQLVKCHGNKGLTLAQKNH